MSHAPPSPAAPVTPVAAGTHAPPIRSGNEAIARGAWEAGARVGVGYPGTPSTEILEALARLPDVHCQWSPNEKVALEVAVGASLGGGRALATMKHVGLNVAADPLFSVAYMGVNAGLVIVTADDPGMHSSQNEQDNRLFARAARIPLLEPATPEEARTFTRRAFELSEAFDTPVLLRTTTRLSHGTGPVREEERREVPLRPYRKDRVKNVVLPAHGRVRHRWIEQSRMPDLAAEAERWTVLREGTGPVAVVTAGLPYLYALEAFPDAPILKLGITHPLPAEAVRRFAETHALREIVVVEELEPVLEEQLRAMGIAVAERWWPRWGELSVALLRDRPGSFQDAGSAAGDAASPRDRALPTLPGRPPVLCPGCAHRGAFHALKRLDAIVSGDIGCYTLGALPPLDAMDACMNMGASIGMAQGMRRVLPDDDGRPVFAVIGDSTFYHSGITGLLDVVYNGDAGTTIVLDNHTTAMTGHQGHPGTGTLLGGESAPRADIAALARAVGVRDVRSADAYDLLDTWRVLDDASRTDEPTVVVARSACVLKEKVVFDGPLVVDPEKCTDCHACTALGCPAIEELDGRIHVDDLLCIACTHCQQVCSDCNAGIDIPLLLELVERDRMDEAVDLVLKANPLPGVSARVCPHPCDHPVNALGWPQARLRAERYPSLVERFPGRDGDLSVRAVEEHVAEHALAHPPVERLRPAEERPRSAVVVGSGPSGLSAAWELRRKGWQVTVLEGTGAPGGMLRHGIPAFRLPRGLLDAELERFTGLGVRFRCGVKVGRDVTLTELREAHDAVVLAVGLHRARGMALDGADEVGERVVHGLPFLERFNAGDAVAVGGRVAVVGGGNTAVDCARAAARLGAEAVVVYRRREEEMPAIPDEVEEARREGVRFLFQRQPVRVVPRPDGTLAEVETVAMEAGAVEADGRSRPVTVEGSQAREAFDLVILAVGEEAELDFLAGSGVSHNGRIDANFAGATSLPGVYACGDAATGHGTVTQAVASGRRAAELAHRYLESLDASTRTRSTG